MSNSHTKVLGYIATLPGKIDLLCDGDSCIIAGSEKTMKEYIANFSNQTGLKYSISKARYGRVLQAMKLGAAYSFDHESYLRFCPLATEDGMDFVDFTPEDKARPAGLAVSLMRVQWISE